MTPRMKMEKLDIACVILAAGASRRFGSPKMLHRLPNDKRMVEQTLRACLEVFDSASVVVRSSVVVAEVESTSKARSADDEFKSLLNCYPVSIVESTNSGLGLSQSIIAGVRDNLDADAWVFVLGDMPYVRPETIQSVRDRLTVSNIVLPRFRGRAGNPVGFGAFAKDSLLELEGDRGAKSITQKNAQRVIYVDTDDEGVVIDLDYPSAVI